MSLSSGSRSRNRQRKPSAHHQQAESWQSDWHEKYLMCKTPKGCACLLCGSEFTLIKSSMLERHFSIAHNVFHETHPLGSEERRVEVARLLKKFTDVIKCDDQSLVKISSMITSCSQNRNPEDADLFKELLIDCANELLREGIAKEQLVSSLKRVKLGHCEAIEEHTEIPASVPDEKALQIATCSHSTDTLLPDLSLNVDQIVWLPIEDIDSALQSPLKTINASATISTENYPNLSSEFASCNWYSLMLREYSPSRIIVFARMVTTNPESQNRHHVDVHYVHTVQLRHGSTIHELASNLRLSLGGAEDKLAGFTLSRGSAICESIVAQLSSDLKQLHARNYCVIAEAISCLKPMTMDAVTRIVVKMIGHLGGAGKNPQLYAKIVEQEVDKDEEAKHRAVSHVGWYRYRKILPKFLQAIPELVEVTNIRRCDWPELVDQSWIRQLTFLTDFSGEFEALLAELKTPEKSIWESVKALIDFRDKIEIWMLTFQKNQVSASFGQLKNAMVAEGRGAKVNNFAKILQCVLTEFNSTIAGYSEVNAFFSYSKTMFYLPKKDVEKLILALKGTSKIPTSILLDEFIKLSNDSKLYVVAKTGGDVWQHLDAYPNINAIYQRILSTFSTTYLCASKIDAIPKEL